jgi:NAD(P)-dependent dehydrogenase (short-subunit alcohol dehydrogenase family)
LAVDPGASRVGALVTGHSRGLGEAIAAELLARGIAVLGLSRSGNTHLAARHPDLLHEISLDLGDGAGTEAWLASDALAERFQACATIMLVNNAGTLQPMGPLHRQDPGAVARALALNVAAPLALSAAFVRATPHATDRRIVHISSGAGRNPYPGWSVYCASKAALDHHARSVAADAVPGVRICSLAPGVIATAMQAEIRASDLVDFPMRERFEAMHREGVLLDPTVVAERVVGFLLDDAFGREPVADLRG